MWFPEPHVPVESTELPGSTKLKSSKPNLVRPSFLIATATNENLSVFCIFKKKRKSIWYTRLQAALFAFEQEVLKEIAASCIF